MENEGDFEVFLKTKREDNSRYFDKLLQQASSSSFRFSTARLNLKK